MRPYNMCFSEFIGYTCGHSSPEVLRPCPMTTQFYTNPLCTQHARRPILAPEMCPACQRVVHGRAVLITEWEHRWMHERGACGCEVRFPDLIRPRVFSRSRPAQTTGNNDQVRNNTQPSLNNGIARDSHPKTGGSNMAGSKKVPARYQERSTKTGEDKPEVAVRIPSLYGAEWVEEHRQLHKDGSCKCAGDFSFYQIREPYHHFVPSTPALVENGPQQVVRAEAFMSSQGQSHRNLQNRVSSQYLNPQDHPTDIFHNSQLLIRSDHQPGTMIQPSPSATSEHLTLSHTQGSVSASPNPPPLVVSSNWPHTSQPRRSPGAIYEVDPTKSTNKLYNLACKEGANITGLADFQSIEFPRPKGTLPLVGLPIGAGPEGPPELSHVGSFQDCVMHTKNLIACMGEEPCPLIMRSKSFCCLHDLKIEDEMLDRERDTRQHTRSICSSAQSSGDSSADEDQLCLN